MRTGRALLVAVILGAVYLSGCAAPAKKPLHQSASTASSSVQGQQVVFPKPSRPEPHTYHTVLPQETLWRISKRYGVPVRAIMRANNIYDVTNIKVGRRILIPGTTPGTYPKIPLFPDRGRWTHIVIHHTATTEGDADFINHLHLRRGWKNGMGYHFLIDNGTLGHYDGEIEVGRRWVKQMKGAHANKNNMNDVGIGVSLVGNFSESKISEKQLKALAHVVRTLQSHYDIPAWRVIKHRDVPGAATECPGLRFPWKRFRSMIL